MVRNRNWIEYWSGSLRDLADKKYDSIQIGKYYLEDIDYSIPDRLLIRITDTQTGESGTFSISRLETVINEFFRKEL